MQHLRFMNNKPTDSVANGMLCFKVLLSESNVELVLHRCCCVTWFCAISPSGTIMAMCTLTIGNGIRSVVLGFLSTMGVA